MKVGCHVSIRSGYLAAAQYAKKMGARCFQFFPKNPRSLKIKVFDEKDTQDCAVYCKKEELVSIAHAPYPVNLSEVDKELRKAVCLSLVNDLEIVESCGGIGLVVHFGKYRDKDPLEGYKLMIEMLNEVLLNWRGQAFLLIENNAGQGVRMGTTLEELVQVRNLTDRKEKIGFCLDTCHAFASDLWNGTNWGKVVERGKELDFFTHLKAVHLNDSAYDHGSFRDRHANIGKGFIGEVAMRTFLHSEKLKGLPFILETPQSQDYTHANEIKYVLSLNES